MKRYSAIYILFVASLYFCFAGNVSAGAVGNNTASQQAITKTNLEYPHQDLNFTSPVQIHVASPGNHFPFQLLEVASVANLSKTFLSLPLKQGQINKTEISCSVLILIFPFHQFW